MDTPEPAAEDVRLAAGLFLMLYDAHPVYGNTAGWRGGIGGAAITHGCSLIDPPPGDDWTQMDMPSKPLREWLQKHPEINIRAEADALKAELLRDLAGGRDG